MGLFMTPSRRGFFATLAALPAVVMGQKARAASVPTKRSIAPGHAFLFCGMPAIADRYGGAVTDGVVWVECQGARKGQRLYADPAGGPIATRDLGMFVGWADRDAQGGLVPLRITGRRMGS